MKSSSDSKPVAARSEFSIRVVSRLTGLSSDTLRIWERRYGYPRPERAESGSRLYSRSQLERLTRLSRAIKLGFRIGEMVGLDDEALRQRLSQSNHVRLVSDESAMAHDLVDCAIADELNSLRVRLRRAAAVLGTKRFVSEVASPLLRELGEAWSEGILEVHQEHAATEILQSQLYAMASDYDGAEGPTILLATLPRGTHGLGLQLVQLYAAACGALPRMLGVDTPTAQIAKAAESLRVDVVALSISVAASSVAIGNHLNHLDEALNPKIPLWVGGEGATRVTQLPGRVRVLTHWDEFEDALTALPQFHGPT